MAVWTFLIGFAGQLGGIGLALLAAVAVLLPSRYWEFLDRLPVRLMALPSALATSVVGLVLGGRGFFAYARLAADAASNLTLEAATRQAGGGALGEAPITTLAPQMLSIASVVAFTLFTPLGWLATYLTLSGVFRVAAVVTDHATGDPLLTGLDELARSLGQRTRLSTARRRRAREEGREVADRLFTGEGVGLTGVDYAVVASRRKPDWTAGTIVMTSEGWYRLGEPFDARLPYGLRTVYPLTRLDTAEVLRKAVRYELPPVQRGPGRLT